MGTSATNYQAWLSLLSYPTDGTVKNFQIWLMLLTPDLSFGDNLNNWSDVAVHDYVSDTPLYETAASTFSLSDTALLSLFAQLSAEGASAFDEMGDAAELFFIAHLGEESASDLDEWDDTSSLQLFVNLESTGASSLSAWLDGLAIFTPVGLEKFPEDTLVLSDSSLAQLAVQLTEALGDDFELTEALEIIQGYHTLSGSDLANWLDAVSNIDPVLRSVADSINNWDEFLALARNWSLSFSDRMTLDDRIKLAYLLTRIVASQIALSDSTLLNKGKLVPFTDTLEISDAATLNFGDWNPYGVADALAQTDGVSLHLSTAEDDYYRRQINDRNMIHGEQMKFFGDQMVMSDGASAWMT
jgi:hypothetical protein